PFMFYGFLARKPKEQLAELQGLNSHTETMIFYEAPHRLAKTLQNLVKAFGPDRQVVLARELTKRYEECSCVGQRKNWLIGQVKTKSVVNL
ncbi:hypothetical protein ACMEOK_16995, partial [Lactiplantibacillus plantarum]